MGSGLADNVSQGAATGDEFRTAPLWGLGQRVFFLHDGRTRDLYQAILAHASTGSEANAVIARFQNLGTGQQDVLNFCASCNRTRSGGNGVSLGPLRRLYRLQCACGSAPAAGPTSTGKTASSIRRRCPPADYLSFFAGTFRRSRSTTRTTSCRRARPSRLWQRKAPPGFLFAVKASRYLTHMKKLKDPEEPLQRLLGNASGLGEEIRSSAVPVPTSLGPGSGAPAGVHRGAARSIPVIGTRSSFGTRAGLSPRSTTCCASTTPRCVCRLAGAFRSTCSSPPTGRTSAFTAASAAISSRTTSCAPWADRIRAVARRRHRQLQLLQQRHAVAGPPGRHRQRAAPARDGRRADQSGML